MRIGIGAQLLSYPRASRSGVGSYIRLLLEHLPLTLDDHELVVFADERRTTAGAAQVTERPAPFPLRMRAVRLPYEQLVLPALARRAQLDVFHHPDPLATTISPAPRIVVTVHDLTAFRFPETFGPQRARYKQAVLARAVTQAHRVVADTDATGRDLVELLDVDPDRVTTVHLGVDACWHPPDDDGAAPSCAMPYVLSVGTLEPRKNLGRLLQAFALARARGLEARLIIVGPSGWKTGSLQGDADRHAVADAVEFAGYVPTESLRRLYGGAAAVVYPSLYEGFGLPVLEAMACGAPVIASSTPAVAEVAGSAAVLVEPTDVDSIATAIEEVTGDARRQRDLRRAGLARASAFRWSETARLTVQAYVDAAST